MIIVLTGEPGIGKTTIVKNLVKELKEKAKGFYTEEVRQNRQRIGFRVVNLNGNSKIFASKTFTSKFLVGSYGVNITYFEETIKDLLEEKSFDKDKIYIIDEVGKMELFSKKFKDFIKKLITMPNLNAVITIPIRDTDSIIAEIRRLKGSYLLKIDKETRDLALENILAILGQNAVV